MKRIILFAFIISFIYCSYDSCSAEESVSKCSLQDLDEIDKFSCYGMALADPPEVEVDEDEDFGGCIAFPDTADYQKIYWRLAKGYMKEKISVYQKIQPYIVDIPSIIEPTKDFFGKDEVVYVKYVSLTDEEKKIVKSENTCQYKFEGKFTYEHNEKFVNITDKNECFNTQLFPDFRNLLNCGYATINFNISGNLFTYKTCYFIPDNHLPVEFQKMFHAQFLNEGLSSIIESYSYESSFSVKSNKANKQRKLEENDFKFEIEIEDKFGKKYKYNDYNDAPEIIEEGLQGNKYIYDENGTKMIANYSLLLLIIPLILF